MNVVYWVLMSLVGYAVYTDMTKTRISNRLIVLGLILGFFFRIITESYMGVLFFVVNLSIPVILLYLLFQVRALGAGDIKLLSMIGTFISAEQLLRLIVSAFCIGAVMGICKMGYKFVFQKGKMSKLTKIHFSPAIFIAYLMVIGRGL